MRNWQVHCKCSLPGCVLVFCLHFFFPVSCAISQDWGVKMRLLGERVNVGQVRGEEPGSSTRILVY